MNWSNLLTWVKSLPTWAKSIVLVIVALAASVLIFTSCSTVKTYMNSNGKVSTTVTQSVLDSTSISVNVFSQPNK